MDIISKRLRSSTIRSMGADSAGLVSAQHHQKLVLQGPPMHGQHQKSADFRTESSNANRLFSHSANMGSYAAALSSLNTRIMPSRFHCYDANKDFGIVKEWYGMVSEASLLKDPIEELKREANDETGKKGTRMLNYMKRANASKKDVADLTKEENLAVIMYTDDTDDKAFFKEYNLASAERNWEPYRVYTTILMSALKMLAVLYPLQSGTILYRGIKVKYEHLDPQLIPDQIYLKTFTSTSLDRSVAKEFSRFPDGSEGTVLEFHSVSRHAVQIHELSIHPGESEVFLSPFESFDFDRESYNRESNTLRFKKSATQDFLPEIDSSRLLSQGQVHLM